MTYVVLPRRAVQLRLRPRFSCLCKLCKSYAARPALRPSLSSAAAAATQLLRLRTVCGYL